MPTRIQRVWRDFARRMEASITYAGDDYAAEMFRLQSLVIATLRDAGAPVLLGTDTDNAYLVPGVIRPRGTAAADRGGLTPYEALAAGTRNAAVALGRGDEIGTIAAGKRADLLLVEGDPLSDLTRLREPAGVMLDGRWLTRERLGEILAGLSGKPVPRGQP